jgi:hypothetical protein
MEVLPGAHSTVTRWRKMARQWCSTGVDRRSNFDPYFWDQPNQRFHLGPGAVWVDGYWGGNTQAVVLNTPGNTGIIVARFQPELQEVRLVWRPGVGIGGELRDPEGWYETPLVYLRDADGYWQDLRRMVPIPWLPPPVTEMPPWVPRGIIGRAVGPGTPFPSGDPNAGGAGNVLVAYPATFPRWVSGRAFRFTLHTYWTASGGSGRVRFWVADTQGVRTSLVLFDSFVSPYDGQIRTTSVVVRNVTGTFGTAEVVAVLSSEGGTPWPFLHFPALNSRIEVEDVGV